MAQQSFSIKEAATIVHLSISDWGGLKLDKEATRKATKHLGMSEKSGRFSKRLIAQERISEIAKVRNAARIFHYENTLPWDDNGGRLLPTKNHMTYVTQMQVFEGEFAVLCKAFVRDFPALKEEARMDLGPRFNVADYPADIASKFSFKVTFAPIATADDFRVHLKDDEINRIKASARQSEHEMIEGAVRDAWRRLHEVVKSLHEKTADKKAVFRDSLITNIQEITEVLGRINVTNDPELEAMRLEVAAKFGSISPDSLRTDKKVRKAVAQEADDIIAKMAAYYAPTAGGSSGTCLLLSPEDQYRKAC